MLPTPASLTLLQRAIFFDAKKYEAGQISEWPLSPLDKQWNWVGAETTSTPDTLRAFILKYQPTPFNARPQSGLCSCGPSAYYSTFFLSKTVEAHDEAPQRPSHRQAVLMLHVTAYPCAILITRSRQTPLWLPLYTLRFPVTAFKLAPRCMIWVKPEKERKWKKYIPQQRHELWRQRAGGDLWCSHKSKKREEKWRN